MRLCGRHIGALIRARSGVVAPWATPVVTLRFQMHATSHSSSGSSSGTASPSSDAEMQREIFMKAMASGDAQDSTATMTSLGAVEGFSEKHSTTPGSSDEDAFGHQDPLMAVEQTMREAKERATTQTTKEDEEEDEKTTSCKMKETGLADEIDQVVSGRNRRRNRRKRSMDSILGDVLHDALRLRDMGEKPTTDFVYRRAQERVYEEEYGKKPPTAKETAVQYIPFPPNFHLHRLLPLFGDVTAVGDGVEAAVQEAATTSDVADTAQRPVTQAPVYTRNHMNTYVMLPADPWPERSVTPQNPVWTRRDVEADKQKTGGKGLKAWEERMFAPRPNYDLAGEFLDAMDELAHWERQFLIFVRVVPISQRRSLPFLHEWYRLLVHRIVRAERRYIRIRDALLSQSKASASVFARTEKIVEDVRGFYAETHRSLASPNYDPLRMKKSVLAPILRMTDAEFEKWQETQQREHNALAAKLS